MPESNTEELERDENGQYVIDNEGAGEVQAITAQTPADLKQQVDNIEIKGRTECTCNFASSEAINVLREYNNTYKNSMDLVKGVNSADESKIPGYEGEELVEMRGAENNGMAFVLHCSDGVKLPLKMQLNYVKTRDSSGAEKEKTYRCFELPPANDSVDDNVIAIRKGLNDTMYIDENLEGTDLGIAA